MPTLVIVESPAKAKTISRFLGKDYDVQASYGHVRDLPEKAAEIPAEFKKQKWANLGVNVESDFEPIYIVPDDKKRHVDLLKKSAKGVDTILLATDEDREGESISWHILAVLKPAKKVKVQRIVFHEITPEAIQDALANPRDVDTDLVKAQESRRVLDRLYGYTLSPLLWKRVAPKLSAGRVQSVAVRLCVMRERERRRFVAAEYWDLDAKLAAENAEFQARLTSVSGKRVATGRSFDPETGKLTDKSILIDKANAQGLAERGKASEPWRVKSVESKPGQESPPKPFQTSTLQQEAARKLRFTSKRTMQVAQNLYEGIDLKGERIGLITYMRTDSLSLAERAVTQAREVIRDLYGPDYLPAKPVQYKTKSKGAQEAHEAIRPTDLSRRPQDVRPFLTNEQFELYELIWKRTIACQMVPARVLRTSVDIEVATPQEEMVFTTSGKTIEFPGFLRAYVEGNDEPEMDLESQERVLPPMKVGQIVDLRELTALQHQTKPPARYTEPSLIKKLEEEGIGRPSTYVSILSTIQDRGYIVKKGTELVPTFTAFAVIELLEGHFGNLVDITFTARMESELDEIAEGTRASDKYLRDFYLGATGTEGISPQVTSKANEIDYPSLHIGDDPETGLPIVVKIGRFGAYLQRGEGGVGHKASIRADIAPADLTLEMALSLLSGSKESDWIGTEETSGRRVALKTGRFGDYLELEQTPEEVEAKDKPRRAGLPPGMKAKDVTPDDIRPLFAFPRVIGKTEAGEEISALMGRYGPFLKAGTELRNLENWRTVADLTEEEARAILSQPKTSGRGGAKSSAPMVALRELGNLEGAEGPVKVMDGRYGPYVTDGKTNASLPKSVTPDDLSPEMALELLAARRGAPKTKRKFVRKTRKSS